ncbi:MAG: cytidine deaminase [Bacteroidales bacterium]|nr:cytidine deaminase [Bacteroidales bacterium]
MDKTHIIHYTELPYNDLGTSDMELLSRARESIGSAHAPYSHFRVGAAVRLASGEIVTGSNQENIAYPSGLCAERTALFAASAQHPGQAVTALAIIAQDPQGRLVAANPCGACRQVMAEYEMLHKTPIRIIAYQNEACVQIFSGTASLLPFSFEM